MDIHHQLILRILDEELHKAPVEDPEAILDVGTGTGAWAIDMADRWPRAKVTGIDLRCVRRACSFRGGVLTGRGAV